MRIYEGESAMTKDFDILRRNFAPLTLHSRTSLLSWQMFIFLIYYHTSWHRNNNLTRTIFLAEYWRRKMSHVLQFRNAVD